MCSGRARNRRSVMPFKPKEEPRKSELTSMIDMIFLLLIFFLVTLSTSPKTSQEGQEIKVIQREITLPRDTVKKVITITSPKQKVNSIIQVLDRENTGDIYVCINHENFQNSRASIADKAQRRLSDSNPKFISNIRQSPPFGPDALYDYNRLSGKIKQGDKVSIRAPEMLPFEKLIEIYDLVKSKNASAYWGLGPIDELKDLEYIRTEEWTQVY